MLETRTKIGQGGRVVIPAEYRKELGVSTGDELVIRLEKGELRLFTLSESLKRARQTMHKYTQDKTLTEEFLKMRREDAKNE